MSEIDIVLRLVAAAVCGLVLGVQRELNDKPIGMRTLALVSLGAATVSVAAARACGKLILAGGITVAVSQNVTVRLRREGMADAGCHAE